MQLKLTYYGFIIRDNIKNLLRELNLTEGNSTWFLALATFFHWLFLLSHLDNAWTDEINRLFNAIRIINPLIQLFLLFCASWSLFCPFCIFWWLLLYSLLISNLGCFGRRIMKPCARICFTARQTIWLFIVSWRNLCDVVLVKYV